MALEHGTLIAALRPLIGARIHRTRLLVWPNADGVAAADTQLSLSLVTQAGELNELTIRTGPDGQTPVVEQENFDGALPLEALDGRAAAWRAPGFFDGTVAIEAFDLGSDHRQETISGVDMVCFADSGRPAGVRFSLDSGRQLWSVTADDGNRVFRTLPDEWFDEPMALVPIL